MRQILFRAKGNPKYNDGEWYYGVPIQCYDGDWQICTDCSKRTVLENTIGEFTGVCDANGAKIFEGDILNIGITEPRLMDVRWNAETLQWELTDIGTPDYEVNHLSNTLSLAEVINVEAAYGEVVSKIVGNIYDDAEKFSISHEEQMNEVRTYAF